MSAAAVHPVQSAEDFDAADTAFRSRFTTLRLRTVILGISGIIGLTLALSGLLLFGNSLAEWLVRLLISGGGIDIPEAPFRVPGGEMNGLALLFAFACVGFVGVAGGIKRGLRSWDVIAWVLVLSVVGGGVLYSQSRIFLIADELAAAQPAVQVVREGKLSKAADMLPQGSYLMEHEYVLAQMALKNGDEWALKTYAGSLLGRLDRVLLRVDANSGSLPDLRIDVLQRLDRELHGAPYSEVSLSPAAARASSISRRWHLGDIAGVVGSLLLAALSFAALMLFRRMLERLVRLGAWLGVA